MRRITTSPDGHRQIGASPSTATAQSSKVAEIFIRINSKGAVVQARLRHAVRHRGRGACLNISQVTTVKTSAGLAKKRIENVNIDFLGIWRYRTRLQMQHLNGSTSWRRIRRMICRKYISLLGRKR